MPISAKNRLIGIDIGSHAIKVVEIDDTKTGMILKNFGMIELPQDSILEGSIKEMEIVSSALNGKRLTLIIYHLYSVKQGQWK